MAVEGNPGGDPNDSGRANNPNDARGFGGSPEQAAYDARLAQLENDPTMGAKLLGMLLSGITGGSLGKWGAQHGYATGMPDDPTGRGYGSEGSTSIGALLDQLGLSQVRQPPSPGTGPTANDALASASSHAGGGFPGYGDPSSLIYGAGGRGNGMAGLMGDFASGSARNPVTAYGRGRMRSDPNAPPAGMLRALSTLGFGSGSNNASPQMSTDDVNNLFASRTGNVSDVLSRLRNNGSIGSDLGAIDNAVNPMLAKGWNATRDIGNAAKRLGYNPNDYVPNSVVDATDLASTIGGLQGSTNQNVRYANSIARARSGVR